MLLVLFMILAIAEVSSVHVALSQASWGESGHAAQQKIFIVGVHWHNEEILRHNWIPALIALTKEMGPQNVFVSVYGSASPDDTTGALQLLDQLLEESGIPRRVVLDNTTHLDEISKSPSIHGWVETPRAKTELRRIPYLAGLRNLAMQPLYELENSSMAFDKILFLNDVVFQVGLLLSVVYKSC